jgi:hypothetical protein
MLLKDVILELLRGRKSGITGNAGHSSRQRREMTMDALNVAVKVIT